MKVSRIFALSFMMSMIVSTMEYGQPSIAQDVLPPYEIERLRELGVIEDEPMMSQDQPQKQSFWRKHKKKIVAGLVVTGAVITAALLGKHIDKTRNAIAQAGISSDNPEEYAAAVGIVGLFGPLGAQRTIKSLREAVARNVLELEEAITLVASPIGAALAYYFGISPAQFRTMAAAEGIKQVGREVKRDVQKAYQKLKGWMGV